MQYKNMGAMLAVMLLLPFSAMEASETKSETSAKKSASYNTRANRTKAKWFAAGTATGVLGYYAYLNRASIKTSLSSATTSATTRISSSVSTTSSTGSTKSPLLVYGALAVVAAGAGLWYYRSGKDASVSGTTRTPRSPENGSSSASANESSWRIVNWWYGRSSAASSSSSATNRGGRLNERRPSQDDASERPRTSSGSGLGAGQSASAAASAPEASARAPRRPLIVNTDEVIDAAYDQVAAGNFTYNREGTMTPRSKTRFEGLSAGAARDYDKAREIVALHENNARRRQALGLTDHRIDEAEANIRLIELARS